MKEPIALFFSYAPEDEKLRDELAKHLRTLEQQGGIISWYDRNIIPGAETKAAIDAALKTAKIILLLISPDFMASDYRYEGEVRRAIEQQQGDAIVIPGRP